MKIKKKSNIQSLDVFIEKQYGKKGTLKRNSFEKGYERFKLAYRLNSVEL